jgi:hypothetical protein
VTGQARIVVAEGVSSRKGFLRFVLEGEGYEVVGEAATPAELARSVGAHDPDVVVIDDGIGATSVGMVHELAPAAKVVLIWPSAVVPIGGDARVEPSNVLRELGLTVEALTGVACATSLAGGMAGARDAATLREVLARGEAAQLHRPSEPAAQEEPAAEEADDLAGAGAAAAVVGIAAADGAGAAESAESARGAVAGAVAGEVAAAGVAGPAALNRRLGTIALSGAAAAGVLVLALTLGGSRVPVASVNGAAPRPSVPAVGEPSPSPIVPGDVSGGVPGGSKGGGGTLSRGGDEPLCNFYIETCLPPNGVIGRGGLGLSIGELYGAVGDGGAATAKRARHARAGHHSDADRLGTSDRHGTADRHSRADHHLRSGRRHRAERAA